VPGGNPFLFVDQVYVHDRATGTTEIISVNDAGQAGNSLNVQADISADGRFVVFSSFADNLVPGVQSGLQVICGTGRRVRSSESVKMQRASPVMDPALTQVSASMAVS
jgi:hypothetical protein